VRVYRVTVYLSGHDGPEGYLTVLAPDQGKAFVIADRLYPDAAALSIWRIW